MSSTFTTDTPRTTAPDTSSAPGTVLDRPTVIGPDVASSTDWPPTPPAGRTLVDDGPPPRPVPYRFSPRELLLAVRPHQWVKNALVLVAPIATGAIIHPAALVAAIIAVTAFCAASAATYLVNDLADIDADKHHPTKQLRPIAAGTLSVPDARTAAIVAGCLTFGLAAGLGWIFVGVLVVYLVKTTVYSKRLKHIPVVDVATVAVGFVLRVVAGAVAVGVGVSVWLLVAVWAGAVLISLGKRHAEVGRLGADAGDHRAVLAWYRPARTRAMMIITQIVAVTAIAMWFLVTFGAVLAPVATSAVAMILGRFRRLVLAGDVDDPVRVISHDRPIAAASIALGAVMLAGMFV